VNTLKLLSDTEVEALHYATLRILSEVGVILTHPGARQMLTDAGATIQNERVCLPPELVEDCLAKCPPQVSVRGRDGTVKTLGDGSLNFHNLGGARDIHNPATGEHRFAFLQDVRDATRLLDALPNCNTITPFFTPSDVPGPLMSLAMYRHAMPFTTKPLQGPGVQTAPEVRYAVQMAEVLGPPREVLTLSVSPVSPLSFPDHEVEAMLEIARQGIAFAPLPCPTAGTTAPFSIAGAIAQQSAEVLVSLVLAQLVQPGLPMIFCGRLAMMEPRTGISVWGGVEMGLASAGTVQLGHRYGLPVNVYGFSTNAHTLDIQNGFERGLNAVIPALAGADELSGIGEMEAGVLSTYAQMVADNEFAASIHRVRRGFVADEDSLAVDVIATVMNGPRNFLSQKHTTRTLKGGEVFITKLADRSSWETWETGGRRDLAEQAQAESERILREHLVEPLGEDHEMALDEIMSAAEKELVDR
jgi:trimethylamine---corrinoid protein Co-methyltransferase